MECLSEEHCTQHSSNRRPNARTLQEAASPIKIRESLPPDLSSRFASATPFLIIGSDHNKHDRPSRKGSASTDAQHRGEGARADTWRGDCFRHDRQGRNRGEFWGYCVIAAQYDVALYRQRCVQSRQSVAASQGANRVEIGVLSTRRFQTTIGRPQFDRLKLVVRQEERLRGSYWRNWRLSEKWFYSDIQVSKYCV